MNRRKFFNILGFGALASVVPVPKKVDDGIFTKEEIEAILRHTSEHRTRIWRNFGVVDYGKELSKTGILKGRYNPETHGILVDSFEHFEHIETPGIDIFIRRQP